MGVPGASGTMTTDGRVLWSYGLVVGVTTGQPPRVGKIVLRYRANGYYASNTTSKHVGIAMRVADEVVDP